MNRFEIIFLGVLLFTGVAINAFGEPGEFSTPVSAKEARINEIAGLSIHGAFEQMRSAETMASPDALRELIAGVFGHRKTETLEYVKNYLRSSLQAESGEISGKRVRDFNLAKRVLEAFPEDASPLLLSLYEHNDEVTKANVIRAAGRIAGGEEIDNILMRALGDKTVFEEENPDSMGDPLRICDLAYNQLVLRHRIKNVLRTISPGHRVEVRDGHIEILKGKLR